MDIQELYGMLDGIVEAKFNNLQEFRQNQEELWHFINTAYLVSSGLIRSIVVLPDLTTIETHRIMMWWTMLDYQMESLFLNINRQLEIALASLRMASEIARDIARIGNDETKLHIWLNKINNTTIKKQYKKIF
ncbi:MAG: hypothetical protein FJ121_08565 [Deltaproteobacteria bacterium]|nr:hypothetical protein [Deltaproteobacteria bacterium]